MVTAVVSTERNQPLRWKSFSLKDKGDFVHAVNTFMATGEQESKHFIKFMKAKLAGKDPCDIINMYQTPILYSFHSNKSLESKGARTIHVRALTMDMK